MRSHARVWFLTVLCGVLMAGVLPAAAQASFGVEAFTAVNCRAGFEGCAGLEVSSAPIPESGPFWFPKEPTTSKAKTEGFTQAGGRVPFGVTDFKVNTTGNYPKAVPDGAPVSKVRIDVAAGLATAPAAVPTCSLKEFGDKEALPKTGLYMATEATRNGNRNSKRSPLHKRRRKAGVRTSRRRQGLQPRPARRARLRVRRRAETPEITDRAAWASTKAPSRRSKKNSSTHIRFVKGSVEWGKEEKGTSRGDYHDYFTVEVATANPLISSRQILYGTSGEEEDFITNGTSCPGDHTTYVTIENEAKEVDRKPYTTPVGLKG